MKNKKNQVTIKITEGRLRNLLTRSPSIDHTMRVLRHEYSDYDQQWKSGDWKLVSKSFAVEFVKLLGNIEPQHTGSFLEIAVAWLRRENRA